jgi:hypothetical protein
VGVVVVVVIWDVGNLLVVIVEVEETGIVEIKCPGIIVEEEVMVVGVIGREAKHLLPLDQLQDVVGEVDAVGVEIVTTMNHSPMMISTHLSVRRIAGCLPRTTLSWPR